MTTRDQHELLELGRARVTVVTRRAGPVRVRAELSPRRDVPTVVVASRTVRVSAGGRHSVELELTSDGRLAAGSCTPLLLTVRASGAAPAVRLLSSDRSRCRRGPVQRPPRPAGQPWKAASPPTDRRQQTALAFGDRSHWLQPWKAYLDTPPANRLLDAPGVNFFVDVAEADATAQLLQASGFRRARVELSWSQLAFGDASRLEDPRNWAATLGALRRHGLRPLVLLNANHQLPTPARRDAVLLRQTAPAGARSVALGPGAKAVIRPGRTGFSGLGSDRAAEVLITGVTDSGLATLSRPLPSMLPQGRREVTTLTHPPFGVPGGEGFERTLRGWLQYVGTATRFVHDVYGSWDFDVEIWNELSFGSDFLRSQAYFDPPPQGADNDEQVTQQLLRRTVEWLRDPDNGIGPIGIGNGFANQTPFAAGSTSPPGLTAIDKHPYAPAKRFPGDATPSPIRPLDATGKPDGRRDGAKIWRDRFQPAYDVLMPEYFLTAIQTETMIRDLSPITTDVNGVAHGRDTRPARGKPPVLWITEVALDPGGSDLSVPGAERERPALHATEIVRLRAVATLRYLTAYTHKGVRAIDFFAAKDNSLGLISPRFFEQVRAGGGRYPGARAAGLTMDVMRRMTSAIQLTTRSSAQRLSLAEVADARGGRQFTGDGTPRHPDLTNADVVSFLPFQRGRGSWVAPVYVMTRNLARPLVEEPFRLTIQGVDPQRSRVSLYDPLTGAFRPAAITERGKAGIRVEVGLNDSPRLLFIEDGRTK